MTRALFVLSLSMLTPMTFADAIYKTVDEQGNIIYSAEPPPGGGDFEVLDKIPGPSEAEVREAEERQQKLEEYIDNPPEPEAQPQQSAPGATAEGTGSAAVMADWRERKKEARRRSIWNENWPVHHPRHR